MSEIKSTWIIKPTWELIDKLVGFSDIKMKSKFVLILAIAILVFADKHFPETPAGALDWPIAATPDKNGIASNVALGWEGAPVPIIPRPTQAPPTSKEDKIRIEKLINAKTFEDQFNKAVGNSDSWRSYDREGLYAALTLDKPLYKPGDSFEARIFYFNLTNKEPLKDCSIVHPTLKIINSADTEIFTKSDDYNFKCENSSYILWWTIPKNQAGGMFKVKIEDYIHPTVIQTFRIWEYHEKKLDISLDYEKLSYSPGDEVWGKITVKKMDGTPLPDGTTYAIQALDLS